MLPEIEAIEALVRRLPSTARAKILAEVAAGDKTYFPIYGVTLGSSRGDAPTLVIVGGIHGLERIGARVVISYLTTLAELARWDSTTQSALEQIRIVVVPLVNPAGMHLNRRGNGKRVDLMRNAPVHPEGKGAFLLGGQRISPLLPWYMGSSQAMEPESAALVEFVRAQTLHSPTVISIDLHSGYGTVDRLWFPYGYSHRPYHHLAQTRALQVLLDRTLPYHIYTFEPQSCAYTVQGDLWDYLYDTYRAHNPDGVYLPLTLEMGSWGWVRKNPRQLLQALGAFNPILPHREKRTLRRHLLLLDFLLRSVLSPRSWAKLSPAETAHFEREALEAWYGT